MGKKSREKKILHRQTTEARKFTWGKFLKVMSRGLLLVLVLTVLLSIGQAYGLKFLENMWVQLGIVLVVYFALQPWLMREFRPPRQKRK